MPKELTREMIEDVAAAMKQSGGKPTRMSWWDEGGFHFVDIGSRFTVVHQWNRKT